jgi:DNA-binding transcriptional ArsR family regulator
VIARRFRALADPARLLVLHALEVGERSVSSVCAETGLAQGTVSKHLQVLHQHGFVGRRREGQFVYYRLADADALQLCELMCDRLSAELAGARRALSA